MPVFITYTSTFLCILSVARFLRSSTLLYLYLDILRISSKQSCAVYVRTYRSAFFDTATSRPPRRSKHSTMAPQSLSQFRASASPSAEATPAASNDHIDMADSKYLVMCSTCLDVKASLFIREVSHYPTHISTNRILSPYEKCSCSTITTLTRTTIVTTQVPYVETSHPQCGNRHIIGGKHTYRCVCPWKGEHTRLETTNSPRTYQLCSAHSMVSTAITGVQKEVAVEEGTRIIGDVVPGIPNLSFKTKQSVTEGEISKAIGNGDHHQERTVKAPDNPKNLPSDASIVLPTSPIVPSIAGLLAHSQEPSHSFTALPASTTSTYPRPSPPTFLYPTPIVPHQEYHHQQYHHNHVYRPKPSAETFKVFVPTLLARMDYTYTYIPLFYKLVLYTLIALGFFWAILVYYVNFPSAFPLNLMKRKTKNERTETKKRLREGQAADKFICELNYVKRKKEETGRDAKYNRVWRLGAWGGWLESRKQNEKEKPIDKVDKYAHLRSSSESTISTQEPSTGTSISTATPFWLHRHISGSREDEERIELKQRKPHTSTYPTAHRRPTSTDTRIATSHEQQTHTPPAQAPAPLSPANPFLPPILHPRQSSEWLHEHSIFFSSAHLPTSNHSRSTSSGMSYEDVDAMEAQTPLITTRLGSKKEGGGRKVSGRDGSWLDMVDGAVNRAVGRVVRWTDGDGEDGLLLPVANE
jgi:hypothetical protein